jgi:hypothetical protein
LLYLIEPDPSLAEYLFANDLTKPTDFARYTKLLQAKSFDYQNDHEEPKDEFERWHCQSSNLKLIPQSEIL